MEVNSPGCFFALFALNQKQTIWPLHIVLTSNTKVPWGKSPNQQIVRVAKKILMCAIAKKTHFKQNSRNTLYVDRQLPETVDFITQGNMTILFIHEIPSFREIFMKTGTAVFPKIQCSVLEIFKCL